MFKRSETRRGASLSWVVGVVAFLAGILATVMLQDKIVEQFKPKPEPADPEKRVRVEEESSIPALGKIEPATRVRALLAPPGDRIAKIHFGKGDTVTKGQDLVTLESLEARDKDLERLKAQEADLQKQKTAIEAAREAQLNLVDQQAEQLKGARKVERQGEEKQITLLEKQRDAAKLLLDKFRQIGSPTIPEIKIDEQELMLSQFDSQIEIARAAQAEKDAAADRQKASVENQKTTIKAEFDAKLAALPSEDLLEKQRDLLELQKRASVIKAPIDGVILEVAADVGEPTGLGPIVRMANLKQMIVRTEVYEDKVPFLRDWLAGAADHRVEAEVTGPAIEAALGFKNSILSGWVTEPPSKVVGKNRVMSLDPTADADRRVVEVIVELDDKEADQVAAGFIGMQVNVRFIQPEETKKK